MGCSPGLKPPCLNCYIWPLELLNTGLLITTACVEPLGEQEEPSEVQDVMLAMRTTTAYHDAELLREQEEPTEVQEVMLTALTHDLTERPT